MSKYLLYGHGGAFNHGAEAIIRGTVALIREKDPAAYIALSTHFPEQDKQFGLDRLVDKLIPADLSLVPEERKQTEYVEKIAAAKRIYRDALSEIDGDTICVAVGGDNYCYPNWHRQSVFHETAKERGANSILWGCSVQPEMIDEKMDAVLRSHDHIYPRESMTHEALLEHGITQTTLVRDPAFHLEPEEIALPEGFMPGKTVALNISPLMMRRDEWLLGYFVETVRTLLTHAEAILPVAHVIMPVDDDREAIAELLRRLSEEERSRFCTISDEANAAQLKYLISQCEMLVCCRTHASIAAYSTGVPTLVASYSVKSLGLAADLGMSRWVLAGDQIRQLPERAVMLWSARHEVRDHLKEIII